MPEASKAIKAFIDQMNFVGKRAPRNSEHIENAMEAIRRVKEGAAQTFADACAAEDYLASYSGSGLSDLPRSGGSCSVLEEQPLASGGEATENF